MAAPDGPRPAAARGAAAVWAVFALSAAGGFAMGALRPTLQVAVEPAQVLAGLVAYPADNPFGFYQLRVWTLWHQVLAPLLAAGVSERALCVAVSGLLGAIAFAGVALLALAAGAAPWLACGTPFLVALADPTRWGFHYPIELLGGAGHTYGSAGLAWLALALGLLGTSRFGAGGFAVGVAPALHASLGAWLALAAACAVAPLRSALRPHRRALLAGGALGAGLAAASLAAHLAGAPRPEGDPAQAARHLDALFRLWDAHRRPPALASWRGAAVLCTAGIALALATRARGAPPGPRLAGAALAVAAGAGLLLGALLQVVPPHALPEALAVAMPTRLLNLPMVALLPLAVGLLWRRRAHLIARATLVGVACGAFALAAAPSLARVGLPLAGALALAEAWRRAPVAPAGRSEAAAPAAADAAGPNEPARPATRRPLDRTLDAALALACAAAAAIGLAQGARDLRPRLAYLIDRTTHPVLAAAARGEGVLAVSPGIERVQLRHATPLLLDPTAIDMLAYAQAAGPAVARVLRDVYGLDFFDPPATARHKASLPEHPVRAVWESRSPEAWQALARELGFADVLVLARWRLRLPEVARSPQVVLYRIPRERPEGR